MIKIQNTLSAYFNFDQPQQPQPSIQQKPKKKRTKTDRFFNLLAWALSGPIITWPGYEDLGMPEQVRTWITIDRMIELRKNPNGGQNHQLASDTETMWYLSTASFIAPMSREWANVYQYLTREYLKKSKQPLPDFLEKEITLDRYMEEEPLHRLKHWLFKRSFEAMK